MSAPVRYYSGLDPTGKRPQVMKNLVLAAALAASLVTLGCATNDAVTSNDSVMDREYPTGSNLPRKTRTVSPGTDTYNRDTLERAQQDQIRGVSPSPGAARGGGM